MAEYITYINIYRHFESRDLSKKNMKKIFFDLT